MNRPRTLLAASAAMLLLLAAGCGSTQDIFGGGNNSQNGTYNSSIHGTVDSVDTYGHSILLTNTSGYGMLSGSNNGSVRVYYDNNTSVSYNGQNYRPENLDRGDQVDIQVAQNGNQLLAQSMTVTYNATASSQYPSNQYPSNQYPSSQYPSSTQYSTIRGTVQYVDTNARTITLNSTTWTSGFLPGYGANNSTITVRYDTGMNVNVNGQMASVSGLERGDVVDVQVRDLGNSNLLAQNITLVRNVRQ